MPDIARHVEIKEASTMAAGETRVIVIGKDPCGIDPVTNVSCHRLLRYFLPPGAFVAVDHSVIVGIHGDRDAMSYQDNGWPW